MHRTSLAPVLSATLHRVSCWITSLLEPVYFARSMTSTTRQRFVLDSGRVSMIRTRSPAGASFVSPWAFTFVAPRTAFPYSGGRKELLILTTTVMPTGADPRRPDRTFGPPG